MIRTVLYMLLSLMIIVFIVFRSVFYEYMVRYNGR